MSYIAFLDCHTGIDGETLLAALLDVGLSLDTLKQTLISLPLPHYDISSERISSNGVQSTQITITFITQEQEYTWLEIERLLSPSSVPVYIRDVALAILRRKAEAEATVRNDGTKYQFRKIPVSELLIVLFIVVGLKELDITQLYTSALPLISENSSNSYSQIAITLPVTLEILRSMQAVWKPTSAESIGVTPLGAALVATLARFDAPTMTIERVGHGLATQSLSAGNSLHLYLGKLQEMGQQNGGDADIDWVTVLSTNIDNMNGELLGGLMDRLLAAGALDVSYTPMQMKKNRPATMLMIVCPLEKGSELAYILLRETTTLGVRIQYVQRFKAQRTPQTIDTPFGPLLIKVKRLGTHIISAAPEYEECQRIAHEHNIPLADVYTRVQQEIAKAISENISDS